MPNRKRESLACCQPAHYQCQMQVPVQTRLIALILVFVFLSSTAVLPHPTHVQISEYKCMNINALAVHIERTYNYTQHYTQFGYLHWLGRPKATKSMHLPPVTYLKVIFPFIISQAFFTSSLCPFPGVINFHQLMLQVPPLVTHFLDFFHTLSQYFYPATTFFTTKPKAKHIFIFHL